MAPICLLLVIWRVWLYALTSCVALHEGRFLGTMQMLLSCSVYFGMPSATSGHESLPPSVGISNNEATDNSHGQHTTSTRYAPPQVPTLHALN